MWCTAHVFIKFATEVLLKVWWSRHIHAWHRSQSINAIDTEWSKPRQGNFNN